MPSRNVDVLIKLMTGKHQAGDVIKLPKNSKGRDASLATRSVNTGLVKASKVKMLYAYDGKTHTIVAQEPTRENLMTFSLMKRTQALAYKLVVGEDQPTTGDIAEALGIPMTRKVSRIDTIQALAVARKAIITAGKFTPAMEKTFEDVAMELIISGSSKNILALIAV